MEWGVLLKTDIASSLSIVWIGERYLRPHVESPRSGLQTAFALGLRRACYSDAEAESESESESELELEPGVEVEAKAEDVGVDEDLRSRDGSLSQAVAVKD
jgi:hypothetical protein